MAEAANGYARAPEHAGRVDDDLTALLARLGEDVVTLVDSKLGLLKLDLEAQVRGYARDAFMRVVAAVIAAVGVGLFAAGLAFVVVWFLPASLDPLLARALACAAIGTLAIGTGAIVLSGGARAAKIAKIADV